VLLQNSLIAAEFSARHPEYASKLLLLPAGVRLGETLYDLRREHQLAPEQDVFLCPAGLRPVKGLLELLAMSDRVAEASSSFVLAFCGPPLDSDYSRRLQEAIAGRPWSRYLGTIPAPAMAGAMRGANVIVNNSRSEGLANALLEAAALGIPVLASRIPGNAAVVRHNVNGLLFGDEPEYQQYALQLLDRDRRRQLTCAEPQRYPPDREAAELVAILDQAVSAAAAPS
jgi:glycosyltransferase involved in cell wall biosynthesis